MEVVQCVKEDRFVIAPPYDDDPYTYMMKGGDPKTVVPDEYIVVRGGQKPMPLAGTTFSGSTGATLQEAASGVPHGTIRQTTAGQIPIRGCRCSTSSTA
jgi:hypothetical protein